MEPYPDHLGPPLDGSLHVDCPYCGERVELLIDLGGGTEQDYVEDCEVCCRPWRIRLTLGAEGVPSAHVTTLDGP